MVLVLSLLPLLIRALFVSLKTRRARRVVIMFNLHWHCPPEPILVLELLILKVLLARIRPCVVMAYYVLKPAETVRADPYLAVGSRYSASCPRKLLMRRHLNGNSVLGVMLLHEVLLLGSV
jgi:hypothetical protein